MIKLFKYDLNSEFESNKETLNKLDNYVALTEDNQIIHLKQIFKGLIINTINTGTTIYKRTDNQNGKETITLENGENKFTDWNYGFYFDYGMKQNQITSFDLSNYDTSNVTDMNNMFRSCTNLTSLDVSKFNTYNVTNMTYMFQGCTSLTSLDVSSFDTSKVSDMSDMFSYCSGLTSLDLSNFDTSNVKNMAWMFLNCSNLTSLDLSSFDTSKVTDMNSMAQMFNGCNKLTYIKCKQTFKEWCITNQVTIYLPTAMLDGGDGQWEIV